MYRIEIHTKGYGKARSKDPKKDGKIIALETRLIIKPKVGARVIKNFDYQIQATKYIDEEFGNIRDGKYMIESNYKLYGARGYRW